MPTVTDMRHPRGLDFHQQRKVVMLRDDKNMSWEDIVDPDVGGVTNLQGKATCADVAKRAYQKFFKRGKIKAKYDYSKCGRKPWKLTPQVESYIVRKLHALRKKGICTSKTLQFLLAKEKALTVSDSAIRKFLTQNGYRWVPRSQKRKYTGPEMVVREKFAKRILRMSRADLRKELGLSIDGIVLAMPPTGVKLQPSLCLQIWMWAPRNRSGPKVGSHLFSLGQYLRFATSGRSTISHPTGDVARWNHCISGETHMWRKRNEAALPELAGDDPYVSQVPIERAVPLWGGISEGGCGPILFHRTKKCSVDEWIGAVKAGTVGALLRKLNPRTKDRPWRVLCDGEKFLHSKEARRAYQRHAISLWTLPPRSPDLNPIEKFWSWLRRELRRRDLQDYANKKVCLTKAKYIARVEQVLQTAKAQRVAANIAGGLKKVCKEVAEKGGAAAGS